MDKLRVGLIGCGGIMSAHANYSFDTMLDDIDIVAVADPVAQRREEFARRYGAKEYLNHAELFDKANDVDCVVIAIPPGSHAGVEEGAIARKLPFKVEKPMTLDKAQAHAVADAVKKTGLVTAVGFQGRYIDCCVPIREALKTMSVGFVNASRAGGLPGTPWWRKKDECGGQLIEQSIHQVDCFQDLFGDFDTAYAVAGRGIVKPETDCPGYDIEDFSVVTFTMKSGVVITLHSCNYLIGEGVSIHNGLQIIGREMSIEYIPHDRVRLITKTSEVVHRHVNPEMAESDAAFFKGVRTGDTSGIRSTYPSAMNSLDACFAAYESMATGKVVKV